MFAYDGADRRSRPEKKKKKKRHRAGGFSKDNESADRRRPEGFRQPVMNLLTLSNSF